MVQVYTQLVIRSFEIENQTAFDNNNLASFMKKWVPLNNARQKNNLIYTVS